MIVFSWFVFTLDTRFDTKLIKEVDKQLDWLVPIALQTCLFRGFVILRRYNPAKSSALPVIFPKTESCKTQDFERNLAVQFRSLLILLIESKLQSSFRIVKTDWRRISSDSWVVPITTTLEQVPLAIWTDEGLVQGLNVFNKCLSPVIWSNAPEGTIQGF